MAKLRILALALLSGSICLAASGPAGVAEGANDRFQIRATLYKDHDAVEKLLGQRIEKGVVVVDVAITPRGGKPLQLWRDDFILRSDKDGEKSEPYDPGQIASNYALVLVYTSDSAGVRHENNGPVWGGVGGRPRRLPGSGGGVGNTPGFESPSGARASKTGKDARNELLAILRNRVLQEAEITEPVRGLLYFPLEGKHKTKQIWLHYVGQAGKLDLRFRPRK